MDEEKVNLSLSPQEALVLFEWLTSSDEVGGTKAFACDDAERQVLWDIQSQLEKILADVFTSNYKEKLASAKKIILSQID